MLWCILKWGIYPCSYKKHENVAFIYLFVACLFSLQGNGQRGFSFEAASVTICPVRSEELHLLMAARGVCC